MGIKKIKPIIIPLFLSTFLFSNSLELKADEETKNYFVYSELKNSKLNQEEVLKLLSKASYVSNKLFHQYAKAYKHDETLAVSLCMKASKEELIATNASCIVNGLSLSDSQKLKSYELNSIIEKLENTYPNIANKLKIVNSPMPFSKLVASKKEIIFDFYFNSTNKFLFEKLNYKLPRKTLRKIEKDKNFEKFLLHITRKRDLNFLHSTFFNYDDKNLSSNGSFYLALLRVINKKIDKKTFTYFRNAYEKAKSITQSQKALFWMYLTENRTDILKTMINDKNLNIYTIIAKELNKQEINFKEEEYPLLLEKFFENCTIEQKILANTFARELSSFNDVKIKDFNLGLMQLDFEKLKKHKLLAANYNEKQLLSIDENLKYFYKYYTLLEDKFITPIKIIENYAKDDFKVSHYKYSLENSKNIELEPYLTIELSENSKFIKDVLKTYTVYKHHFNKEFQLNTYLKTSVEPLDYLDY